MAREAHKVAFVLPRYGASLGGGAETLCRDLMLRAKERGLFSELEVWTTCAVDHRTWDNELPSGKTQEDGISVSRFPVDSRDVSVFLEKELAIQDGRILAAPELLDWMANSVNSKELYSHIAEQAKHFDFLFFAPYLFATTFWGSLIAPEKSVLIPCLHDEPYALQKIFQVMFEEAHGLIFNTDAERDLLLQLYGNEGIQSKSHVVGMGFDKPSKPKSEASKADEVKFSKYFIYAGRKEEGKNLDLLIDYFESFSESHDCGLVLIGSGEINFRESLPESVIDLGFVSESDKAELIAGAMALLQPSLNESFSIVMMEAWLLGTPVISHALCDVTREHVVKSGGGLYFSNQADFKLVLIKLLSDEALRQRMSESGKRYVETEYSWEAALCRLETALSSFLNEDHLKLPKTEEIVSSHKESSP